MGAYLPSFTFPCHALMAKLNEVTEIAREIYQWSFDGDVRKIGKWGTRRRR
ncbi:unnamed protein product [Linum tenue]|uniref:Uncharacterized protein n=1 Tax=Linum tenue TaxID=586396 RepID=A0AAV0L8Y9_9ROSI|nr:unnamed protein product [Linum tenue]